jgi:hypothetical protein
VLPAPPTLLEEPPAPPEPLAPPVPEEPPPLDDDADPIGTHLPPWHVILLPQGVSSSFTETSQPVSPQRSNTQGLLVRQDSDGGATQVPAASHFESPTNAKAAPSQCAFSQTFPGAASPHVPSLPPPFAAALHALHGLSHAVLQQTSSTQKPVGHSSGDEHGVARAGEARESAAMMSAALAAAPGDKCWRLRFLREKEAIRPMLPCRTLPVPRSAKMTYSECV